MFWAARWTTDNGCSDPTPYVAVEDINIAGFQDLEVHALFAKDIITTGNWDANSRVAVSVSIDGGGFIDILCFAAPGVNTYPQLDANCDGIGDGPGTGPTDTFTEYSAPILSTGTLMDLRVTAYNLDENGEDFAWDNLQVYGDPGLPVELVSFTGVATDEGVTLQWATASEQNNAGFTLERAILTPGLSKSSAALAWAPVTFTEGHGTTLQAQQYQYLDRAVEEGRSYVYRLRQVDFDGAVSLSHSVEVALPVSAFSAGVFYPNPLRGGDARIEVTAPAAGDLTITLYDVLGREVRHEHRPLVEGRTDVPVSVEGLAAGLYVAHVKANGHQLTRSLLVQ